MQSTGSEVAQRNLWLYAAGFLCLHTACMLLFPAHAAKLSSLFLVAAPAIATLTAVWCVRYCAPSAGRLWSLLALALCVWTIASAMDAHDTFVQNAVTNTGTASQILYFMYGIPILLAIATPAEESWSVLALWLDGIQIAIVGFLTYVVTFSIVPFSHAVVHPVAAQVAALTFDIQNLVLAAAATLRFFAALEHRQQRRFHRDLMIFLWVYAAVAAIFNHVSVVNTTTGLYDLLVDIPFLLLAIFTLLPQPQESGSTHSRFGKSLALLIDNGSPTLFPATVLALGISILHDHFHIGIAAIVFSMAVYGLRSTVLQFEYQQSQLEARKARDSMEIIALTDPLTGIANRRHFDLLIQAAWDRLSQQHGPLSLLMIDIDYFKLLNDAFGHAEGDVSLRQVAHALQASLQREADILARYGGEEFAAILSATDRIGAEAVALRMRNTLAIIRQRNHTPLGDTLTVSIGASTCHLPCKNSIEDLFAAADRALYRAKQNGRNRYEFEPIADRESRTNSF
jgi:diguanylate cyclase (GGDEF)-like protein